MIRSAVRLVVVLMVAAAMPAPAGQPRSSRVDNLAWLAGSWRGEAFGGTFEETWNPPSGGTMVGMFKLVRDSEPEFYELMVIREREGALVLEVKHFTADFVGWEEKHESEAFRLVKLGDGVAAFDGLVFERQDDGTIIASLRMGNASTGETRTERLVYRPVEAR